MFKFLLRAFASVVVCLALASCSKHPNAKTDLRALCPGCNVILISMDTVRADHVGAYGYSQRPTTPNLDAFATHAAVFEHAVSQSSWTLPAHGAMMTGLYPGRLGVTHYPAQRRIPEDVPMLAEVMGRSGYATAGFTGGGFVSRHFGFDRGFETYASDGRRFEHNIDEALAWLIQNEKRKFFLFLHGYDAHRPYFSHQADKRAVGVHAQGAEKKRFCEKGRNDRPSERELKSILGYYDASIRMGDRVVGRVLDLVRERGLMDNTVILVTSDHGEEFFDHGNCDHVRFLYHEIIHVPYILHVPRATEKGRRIPDVVPASISVARTLLEAVGVENDMPGASLIPLVKGKSDLFGAVFSEADSEIGALGSRGATIAMTGGRYKLISYLEEGNDEGYDLIDDPRERKVLPESRDVYAQRPTLRAWHAATDKNPSATELARARESGTDEDGKQPTTRDKSKNKKPAGAPKVAKKTQPGPREKDGSAAPPPSAPAPTEQPSKSTGMALPDDVKEQLRSLGYAE